jgi:hypothetical protein
LKSSNDKSKINLLVQTKKRQMLTIAYASKESQFISLGSISGRAKIELLHENENAQCVGFNDGEIHTNQQTARRLLVS